MGIETVVLLKAIIILLRFIAGRKQGACFGFSASACSQGVKTGRLVNESENVTIPIHIPQKFLSGLATIDLDEVGNSTPPTAHLHFVDHDHIRIIMDADSRIGFQGDPSVFGVVVCY